MLCTGSRRWFLWNITSCCLLRQTVLCTGHILGDLQSFQDCGGHCGRAGCLWAGRITTVQVLTLSPGRHVSSTFWVWQTKNCFCIPKEPHMIFSLEAVIWQLGLLLIPLTTGAAETRQDQLNMLNLMCKLYINKVCFYFFKKRKLILEVSKRRIRIKIYFPYISLEIWKTNFAFLKKDTC